MAEAVEARREHPCRSVHPCRAVAEEAEVEVGEAAVQPSLRPKRIFRRNES